MADALHAAYDPSEHPHAPAGSSTGGQFADVGSTAKKAAVDSAKAHSRPARKRTARPPSKAAPKPHDDGTLSYDPKTNRGTGYGSPDGDPRVHKLQQALNRLGLTDSAGKPLKDDGKLGPKTTAAVRRAQHQLGLPVDGKVTPALLAQLGAAKPAPKKATRAAAADPQQPYGDVEYADLGYQSDGKKRYPLDSEAHCRSALAYISMPKNAAMYTAEQLSSIKSRILAAGKKYGIDFADQVKAAASDLRNVELARPGDWKVATGDGRFTVQDLVDAAAFYEATGGQAVPIKIGHVDDRWDGEPAFGNVRNVHYLEDERGPVLRGDITDMPEWLAASAPKRWPNRSIEGWRNVEYEGRTYSLVLTALAFLGVTPPAVRNIRSLADLQSALAASSAQRVFASAPPDDPVEPPEAATEAPPSAGLSAARPKTPAPPAEIPHTEGAGMNLAKYREALAGLPDDASEEDVEAALIAAGFAPQSPAPPDDDSDMLFDFTPEPAKELVTASAAQKRDQRLAAAAARGGVVTIDATQLAEFQAGMVQARELHQRLEEQDRDTVIASAVKAGKFPPSRRAHYELLWKADPAGTKELIGSLSAGLVPVTASGYDTDAEDAMYDAEFSRLFPPTRKENGRG